MLFYVFITYRFKPGVGFILSFLAGVVAFGQYMIGWTQYYQLKKRLEKALAESLESASSRNVNDLSYNQLRRLFKKQGITELPAPVKRAIKSGIPTAEILAMPEVASIISEIDTLSELQSGDDSVVEIREMLDTLEKPKIWDLFIFSLPVWIIKNVVSLPSTIIGLSSGKKKDLAERLDDGNEDEEDEEDENTSGGNREPKKKSLSDQMKEKRMNQHKKKKSKEQGEEEEEELSPAPQKKKKKNVIKKDALINKIKKAQSGNAQ
jgi:hypothetical protein